MNILKFVVGILIVAFSLQTTALAEETKAFSFYGLNENANNGDNESGIGFDLDTEHLNLTVEATSQRYGLSSSTKFNVFDDSVYMKLGGAYASEKYYAVDESLWAKQYAFGGALGRKVDETIYVEVGSIFTNLEEEEFSNNYVFLGEKTVSSYLEAVKRFDFGRSVIDFSANYAYESYKYSENSTSFGFGADLYPTENIKLSAYYQKDDYYDTKVFSAQWNYLYIKYQPNNDYIAAGIEFTWGNDGFSLRKNLVKDISDNHRFENNMNTNIEVKSRGIVEVVTEEEVVDEEEEVVENTAPTGESFTINVDGATSASIDVSSYTNDVDGDTTTVEVVSYSVTFGDIVISSVNASGETINISVSDGSGEATIVYRVYDGTDYSGTTYNITVEELMNL